jgi:hypothetical protein
VKNAIIVAGHAILRDLATVEQDEGWYLLDFQRGEPTRYIEHIRCAVDAAAEDPEAMLIFSGGPTRAEAGPRTEALSYWLVAEHYNWFGHPSVRARAYLEDFARDSFENLLFGICRFQEAVGCRPQHVSVVSWEFKRERFAELHREAIGWPRDQFSYIGANDPEAIDQALRAEAAARGKYRADPYSLGPEFSAKKQQRNPFRRQHGYATSCPEWFGPDKPWSPPAPGV